ncbi:MAG: hypothetical protein R3B72_20835 [Polyangiaceae bacterium]
MGSRTAAVAITSVFLAGVMAEVSCAASGSDPTGPSSSSAGGATGAGGMSAGPGSGGGTGGMESCAQFTAEATQAEAAMLFNLDMTSSMNGSKWGAAQLATVAAIDKDIFDSMYLGLVTFPTTYVNPPPCLCANLGLDQATCNLLLSPGVSCGVSALPQIPIALAGPDKSNAGTGVRSSIYNYLVSNSPISTQDDGSPVYEALLAGYNALKLVPNVEARIQILVTDGGFSCTSLSTRTAFQDANNCADWEHPNNINDLISAQFNDPSTPVRTFIVGVPGSDTTGSNPASEPPYNMKLALSTYAVNGSPDTVDPACDSGAVFDPNAGAPATPCHFDMTSNPNLDATALADIIAQIRGAALGCVYALPTPPPGEEILPDQVNVEVTIDGVVTQIPRRSDPNDACATEPCWDYNVDGDVEILGVACTDLGAAASAKVDIVVGCATILK